MSQRTPPFRPRNDDFMDNQVERALAGMSDVGRAELAAALGMGAPYIPDEAPADTTARLQERLDAARDVSVLFGAGVAVTLQAGTVYTINDTLVVYDNTTIDLNGAKIKMKRPAADQGKVLIANEHYFSSPIEIPTGGMTSSGRTVTIDFDGTAHGRSVGDWISVQGCGTRGYNGVWQVATVPAADQLTYVAFEAPAASPGVINQYKADTDPGDTYEDWAGSCNMEMRPCNLNIEVSNGAIDYNTFHTTASGTQDERPSHAPVGVNTMGMIFYGVYDLRFSNLKVENARKYKIFVSAVRKGRVWNLETNGDSDGIHGCGNCIDWRIDGMTGKTGDNIIGWGTADFADYQLALGPMIGLHVTALHLNEAAGVRLFGESENYLENLLVEGVTGSTDGVGGAVDLREGTLVLDGGTKVRGGCTFRHVSADTDGGQLVQANPAECDTLTLDNCVPTNDGAAVQILDCDGTIDNLVISNASWSTANNTTAYLFKENTNIENLTMQSVSLIGTGTNGKMVTIQGAVRRVSMIGCSQPAGNAVLVVDGASVDVDQVSYVGCWFQDVSYMFNHGANISLTLSVVGSRFVEDSLSATRFIGSGSGVTTGNLTLRESGCEFVGNLSVFSKGGSTNLICYGWNVPIDITLCQDVAGTYANNTNASDGKASGGGNAGVGLVVCDGTDWAAL